MQARIARRMSHMSAEEWTLFPMSSVNALATSDLTQLLTLWTSLAWQLIYCGTQVVVACAYVWSRSAAIGSLTLTLLPLLLLAAVSRPNATSARPPPENRTRLVARSPATG